MMQNMLILTTITSLIVQNMLGLFDTYVYTKATFDPTSRIVQECKYFGKDMIYARDKNLVDGGSVYWNRPTTSIFPILEARKTMKINPSV